MEVVIMSRKLTSIRLDENLLNEFIFECTKCDELIGKTLGRATVQPDVANMTTTEIIHMAIVYATNNLKETNRSLDKLYKLEE